MTEVRAEKVNEAVAYILRRSVSRDEADARLRGLGFTDEGIALVWATVEQVRAATRLQAKPEPEPEPPKPVYQTKKRFGVAKPTEGETKKPKEDFSSAPLQPEEVTQPEGEEEPKPETVGDAEAELLEELEADVAEHRRRKLWRVESALKHLGPKGFDPRKAGAVIWRLTEGSPQGRAVFEDWFGEGAHDLWAKGFGKVWCGVGEIYRAAISRGGWRYRVVLSPNRLNQVAEQSEKAMVRAKAEIFQAASELVRPVRIEVEATKKRKIKAAVLHKIDKAFLKTDLTRWIDFHHIARNGGIEPCGRTMIWCRQFSRGLEIGSSQ
jgi:hypothetical protein